MPPSLRSRGPLCHYCNRWSSSKNKGTRHFRCENCLAENFLDEHGEIVDVPPEKTSSPRHLSRPFAKRLPDDQGVAKTATFCSTCLKNQHLLTETLANYLPSPGDPTYEQYEASYPEFRQRLEERYPPVCARCEPEVRRRIQQAGYTAKSDHLRRMMERSRARRIASRWGWRSLVVSLGALFFWSSIMGQLAWDLISVLEEPKKSSLETGKGIASPLVHCAAQCFTDFRTDSGCAAVSSSIGFAAIVLGLLCSWWNPRWQHKLQGREGRLIGLQEYYHVNIAMLLARFGFWLWARDSTIFSSTESGQKVIHSVVMFMTLLFTIYNLTRVKIDTTPLVSWQDSPVQLLSQRQYSPPVAPGVVQQPFASRLSRPEASNAQSFPISSLAPEPRRQVWQAPTPPPDEDADAMEWEPSQTFQPNPRRPKISAVSGPSPFHGALPAMPTNRLLHPHPQRQAAPKEAIGLPPGFFDNRDRLRSGSQPASLPTMAQPKFFPQGDREVDTGLESIFDTVFSLRDAPIVAKVAAAQNVSAKPEQEGQSIFELPSSVPHKPWYTFIGLNTTHAAKIVIFATSLFMLYTARRFQLDVPHLKLAVLCTASSVSLLSALSGSRISSPMPDFSDLVWSVVMAFAAAVLVFQHWSHADREADQSDDGAAMIFFFLCSFWEVPRVFDWKPIRSTKNQFRPALQASPWHELQAQIPAASGAGIRPPSLPSSEEVRQSSSSEARSSASQDSRWQPEQLPPFKPAPPLQATEDRPFYRTRSDSTDSVTSQSSTTTIDTATTVGWRTPNFRAQHPGGASDQSPGFNLRSLALDDGVPTPRRREQNGVGTRNRKRV